MPASCQTISALTAHDVAFAAHNLTAGEASYVGSDFHDLAHKFAADDQPDRNRFSCPFVPLVDVEVGTADARGLDTNQNVIDADRWARSVLQTQTRFGCGFY